MSPDDPRHGTHKGLPTHRREGTPVCEDCRIANRLYQRRQRKIRALYGARMVDATGSRRRVQALMRLGWSAVAIADRLGMDNNNLLNAINRPTGRIYGATAKRIAAVYEEMSMTLPTANTKGERISVSQARGLAQRKGWPPPLAWNDIDDPRETPTDWAYVPASRTDQFRELAAQGVTVSEACRRLRIGQNALEKWAERNGLRDLYADMCRREDGIREYNNQYTKGAA